MAQPKLQSALFFLLLIAYLIVGALYAIRTPAWQVPDEPAHYNYVAQVAANGCCPVLEAGDWDSAYLETIKGARFAPETLGAFASIQYEDHQPPFYYLLASVVFKLSSGSLIALRLLSVLIGAGVVAGAYATGRALLPDQPQIALGAAGLVAFIPQHMAMLAAVNNDGLAELIVALTLWGVVVYLKTKRVRVWWLGVLVGIGLLTKVSTLFLVELVPLAIVAKWWITSPLNPLSSAWRGDLKDRPPVDTPSPLRREGAASEGSGGEAGSGVGWLIRLLIVFAVPVLILGGAWWLRDVSVYGFPDIFGLARHNAVVVGQPRTADLIAEVGAGEYLRRGIETTFESFWGKFGWMNFGLPAWAYPAILMALATAGVGLGVGWWADRRTPHPLAPSRLRREGEQEQRTTAQRAAWAIMLITAVLAVLQYLYYNTEFVQFQGRYMYPGLIPLGIFVALGLDSWRRVIGGRGALRWLAPVVIALLIPLNLYVIWRVIPGLAP